MAIELRNPEETCRKRKVKKVENEASKATNSKGSSGIG